MAGKVSISELKNQLMERIDTSDLVQLEKVERYINLVKSFRKMNRIINKEGESIRIENGSQTFTKAHPLISERNKVNASLLSIEKSFEFEDEDGNKKPSLSDLI